MTAKAALQYTPADICRATGFTVPQQNQHFARGTITPSFSDKKPTGSGDRRLIGSETAYAFAILAACTNIGIQTRRGAEAVRLFAVEQPGRQASKVFEFGRTLLVMTVTGPHIVNAAYDASLIDVCGRSFIAAVTIDLGQIINEVDEKLKSEKPCLAVESLPGADADRTASGGSIERRQ
jgi:hypothetical protein